MAGASTWARVGRTRYGWLVAAVVLALTGPGAGHTQSAWVAATAPASENGRFEIGAIRSENIAASMPFGDYYVTDLGTAPSGTFRRIRNAGPNAIPIVMDGVKILGYAPRGGAGSRSDRTLPVAPGEVVEFVSLGGGVWQLVQYLPLRMQNFGLIPEHRERGIPSASPATVNLFQLGPSAGKGPQPDYPFAVAWDLHSGKLHTHGAYFMLPGDTPNIELRQADMNPKDESPRPWTIAPYLGAHISGRALVDIGGGVYDFLRNDQPGTLGYRHGPSYLYQGFTANIDFPITQPPTKTGVGGALVFKITPNDTITPFQRGWFSNTGNLVEIGKAAFEACGLKYPFEGEKTVGDSPCGDADYYATPGWGNLSVVATDITSARLGNNAAIAVRKYGAHDEGLDVGYDPAGPGTINRYGVHRGARTAVETFDPATDVFTYPTRPAFQARLSADARRVTGDGARWAVRFDAVDFDQGRNFDARSGAFTAPASGVYQLEATLELGHVPSGGAEVMLEIEAGGRTYPYDAGRPVADAAGRLSLHFSVLTRLEAGQTARAVLRVEGRSRTIDVLAGEAARPRSTFSGFLAG